MEPIPEFKNEAEEAAWWDAHPEALAERFRLAKRVGRVRRMGKTEFPGARETGATHIAEEKKLV